MTVHFSSVKMDWRTPVAVFNVLNDEFAFTVDGCASHENAMLRPYWTEEHEPLLRSWAGERVFINPPYGRQISRWMEKAWTEAPWALVVALIPSRTDSAWWHDYVMPADEIRFLRGRLRFSEHSYPAPFPSCVVVWKPAALPDGVRAVSAQTLRRDPEPREQVNRCAKCGRVDVPLNEDEEWHYAVTGEGLKHLCPRKAKRIAVCNWQPFYCAVR